MRGASQAKPRRWFRYRLSTRRPNSSSLHTVALSAGAVNSLRRIDRRDGQALVFAQGQQAALVTVDDKDITAMAFPAESSARDSTNLLYNLGISYSALGQFDEAVMRQGNPETATKIPPGRPGSAARWARLPISRKSSGRSGNADVRNAARSRNTP
jgi:hypothetical protein